MWLNPGTLSFTCISSGSANSICKAIRQFFTVIFSLNFPPVWTHQDSIIMGITLVDDWACKEGLCTLWNPHFIRLLIKWARLQNIFGGEGVSGRKTHRGGICTIKTWVYMVQYLFFYFYFWNEMFWFVTLSARSGLKSKPMTGQSGWDQLEQVTLQEEITLITQDKCTEEWTKCCTKSLI